MQIVQRRISSEYRRTFIKAMIQSAAQNFGKKGIMRLCIMLHTKVPPHQSYSVVRRIQSDRNSCKKKTLCDESLKKENRLLCHKLCTDSGDSTTKRQEDNMSWEMLVDYDRLSPLELKIHERHKHAIKNGELFYVDPATGYQVMTRSAHIQRGECCGNACRHCPYAQVNVPEEKRTKTFNSAFYS